MDRRAGPWRSPRPPGAEAVSAAETAPGEEGAAAPGASREQGEVRFRLLSGGGGSPADEYMPLAGLASYCAAHRRSLEVYADRRRWDQISLINIARSGIFAADRSIRDYAREIWHVPTRL